MIQDKNYTYNGVLNILEAFANAHLDVRRFIAEDEDQMSEMTSKEDKFPVMFVAPENNTYDWQMNSFGMRIYVYDRLMKDRSNVSDLRSKTNQILTDLDVYLRYEDLPVDVTNISQAYTFSSELMTDVTGWYFDISIDVPSYGTCKIPFSGSPVPSDPTCAVGTITNSDDSYSNTVASGGDLILSDITVTTGSGDLTYPAAIDINLSGYTSGGTIVYNTANLFRTGGLNWVTGDDGDLGFGRGVDFYTLDFNNGFGNTNRFTDDIGGSGYTSDVVVDWSTWNQVDSTVLCYYRVANSNTTLTVQLAGQPYTRATLSGWYVPNYKQMNNIQNLGIARNYFNYPPFNFPYTGASDRLWCSTTDSATVGLFFLNTGTSLGGKNGNYKALVCRTYTLAELGL
jgi:hypothetical protein